MTAEIGTKDRARRWTFGNEAGALAERALAADPVDWQKMGRPLVAVAAIDCRVYAR